MTGLICSVAMKGDMRNPGSWFYSGLSYLNVPGPALDERQVGAEGAAISSIHSRRGHIGEVELCHFAYISDDDSSQLFMKGCQPNSRVERGYNATRNRKADTR